ncbi:EcsC family protein [Bacillus altitudinis MN12]|uniref:EcsC family protein n=2 Tax=Bacillus TaxID=1386 RepID=A0AAU7FM99_9BACI|nr:MULTISPECIES: EcsC family protein [Bacillus]EMI15047.1 abc superfamily atp binding cassette binding protein [Bacillus stratosphericus LAMA 585]MBR3208490.1 EcsC family protein [Bacillus sp. (in: firmicutes)]MBY0186776.1 EcsC family protein [Bacillus aerophilus]NQW98235.1 EcsC family protein [Bacillus stratosphericus]CVN41009.1 EcsC protein family [Streptococcus pneumoniae]BAT47616.1 ABC transporter ATP-binding protein [Bacillus pumilus]
MEEREWLKAQLKEIEKWEKDQQKVWFWEKLSRLPFQMLDKLTPAFIQKKIGVLLDEMGHYIQSGGVYLTSEKGIIHQFQKKCADESIQRIEDIEAAPIEVMDAISDQMGKNRTNLATVQGATTGVGGMFTLAADIPAVLGLSLKTLQDIAVTYGYDPKNKEERVFIIKCLQLNSADVVGKKSILKELKSYHASEGKHENMISQIQGWREVVYNYRDSFGWKKLFQLVPIAGILFGAASNRSQLKGIAETGIMQYRKRRILSRLEELAQQEQRDSGA